MAEPEDKKISDDGYEKKDVNAGRILMFVGLTAAILVVIIWLLSDYFTATTEEQIYEAQLKPESAALRELRAREEETLGSYKLLDSTKGTYQIPIDRAMKVMAEEAFRATEKTGK